MKRIISFVLILMLVLSMVGCSDTAKESQSEVTPEQSESTQSEPEEEAVDTAALEQYLNPAPIPAYVVQNPNCCAQQYGCGCGM